MHDFGQDYEVRPNDKAFVAKYYQLLTDVLLPKGQLNRNKATKISGDLNGVDEGFKRMVENKIGAEKTCLHTH